METKNIIAAKLESLGIDLAQFSNLVELIADAIDHVSAFGFDAWLSNGGIYATCPAIAVEESAKIQEVSHEAWVNAQFWGAPINAMVIEMSKEGNVITGQDEYSIYMSAHKPTSARAQARMSQEIEEMQIKLDKEIACRWHSLKDANIERMKSQIAKHTDVMQNGWMAYVVINKADFIKFT